MTAIAERISEVVTRYAAGNVSQAARRLKISQRGLAKVCSGETKHPRADLLEAIVREYRIDANWLVAGIGAPDFGGDESEVRRNGEEARMEALSYGASLLALLAEVPEVEGPLADLVERYTGSDLTSRTVPDKEQSQAWGECRRSPGIRPSPKACGCLGPSR